jgi:hypothetical protein
MSPREETIGCLRQLVAAKEPRSSANEVTRMMRALVPFTGAQKDPRRTHVLNAFRADSPGGGEEACSEGRFKESKGWNRPGPSAEGPALTLGTSAASLLIRSERSMRQQFAIT